MSVNKVILVGHLGRDPELRYMPNGEAVANFSVATSESWKDRNGERQTRTEWHNITLYRKLAEIAGQYLKKGSQVYIEGRIQSRKYVGKDGIERTAYEIIGSEMKMMGSRNDGASMGNSDAGSYGDFDAPATNQYAGGNQYGSSSGNYGGANNMNQAPARQDVPPAPSRSMNQPPKVELDDLEDDIPF